MADRWNYERKDEEDEDEEEEEELGEGVCLTETHVSVDPLLTLL